MIKEIQLTTVIDYPGNIASIVFVGGCNFRCGFCYNKDLVLGNLKNLDPDEVLFKLEKRKKYIDGVVITGGEPTLWDGLEDFCLKVKELGLKVKIDSNGTRPLVLKKLIDKKLVDYIAMDVKGPFEKYNIITGVKVDLEAIRKSIHLIVTSSIDHEFRCTIHSQLLNYEDLIEIAKSVESGKRLNFQMFKNLDVIDESLKFKSSYSKEELEVVIKECNKIIKTELKV